jgi:holo-[acyl-carrier protein] synthase
LSQVTDVNLIGHGIDLVEIAEMQRWIEHPDNPFLPRCFSAAELYEISDGPDRIEHLAGRFAAKEAVMKALGTGFGGGVAFSDITIHRSPGSSPQVRLSGGAAKVATARGIIEWHLSISHAGGIAMASALALGQGTQADASMGA